MEYEDRRTIATPEGVELQLTLAGLGSRFIGLLLDTLIQVVVILAGVFGLLALGSTLAAAIVGFATPLLVLGYYVVFEVLGGGRSPGKRAVGLRVVMDGGQPVGLRASLIRNVIRVFEGFGTTYLLAMVSVLATKDNQRLGDLAAGTIVIRDRRAAEPAPYVAAAPVAYGALDATGVGDAELTIVRSFLARRGDLAPKAREALAAELAGKLRPRVAGSRAQTADEQFLEQLAAAKAQR